MKWWLPEVWVIVALILVLALLLTGCASGLPNWSAGRLAPVSKGDVDVATGTEARRGETDVFISGSVHDGPVRGVQSPEFAVEISVVRAEVEFVIGKVMEEVGDEFVLVEGKEARVLDDASVAGEGSESGDVSAVVEGPGGAGEEEGGEAVGALITARVQLRTVEDARAWMREMLRMSGYRWTVVGDRWWISGPERGGHWVYVSSYGGMRVAGALELQCIGSWCRAHGEEERLLERLQAAELVEFFEAGRGPVLESLEGVVELVEVDGGLVAVGPRWALDWARRVVEVGACIGIDLDLAPPEGFRDVLGVWAEGCGREGGAHGRRVWVPAGESAAVVAEELAVVGSWVMVARVWSVDLDAGGGIGEFEAAGRLIGAGGEESEGAYLARVPWGAGEVALEEETTWRITGAEVTTQDGSVVSESGTDSASTGIRWKGRASPAGLTGWVRWSEGVRGEDDVRVLKCEGEIRILREQTGWVSVCAVTGRSVSGKVQFPWGIEARARDRRYQVEVRAWVEGESASAELERFGEIWRRLAAGARQVSDGIRDRVTEFVQ